MSYASSSSQGLSARRTSAQVAALVFGIIFLVIGVLGFIPGITANYSALYFAGYDSDAVPLGVFQVSVLHNVVHIILGLVGLWMARTHSSAKAYLIGAGVVYLLLFLYGLIIPLNSAANFVPVNWADNWLHLGLGAVMIILGFVLDSDRTTSGSSNRGSPGEGSIPN